MKHLFVVRHGVYGEDGLIDEKGRQQMETLSRAIKEILGEDSAHIFSSTAPRALGSSEVLAQQLDLPEFEHVQYLWSGSDAPRDTYEWDFKEGSERLMRLVDERRERADGLIMVSHQEVVGYFPTYFLRQRFEQENRIGTLNKGQAAHFDLEQRTYEVIPP